MPVHSGHTTIHYYNRVLVFCDAASWFVVVELRRPTGPIFFGVMLRDSSLPLLPAGTKGPFARGRSLACVTSKEGRHKQRGSFTHAWYCYGGSLCRRAFIWANQDTQNSLILEASSPQAKNEEECKRTSIIFLAAGALNIREVMHMHMSCHAI